MKIVRQILSFSMAVLVLFATTGFTVSKHYCMGELKSAAVLNQADACVSMKYKAEMPMDCCEDTTEEYRVEDLNTTVLNFDFQPELHLISVVSFVELIADISLNKSIQTHFRDYSPPPIEQDIPVMVQSFLL